MPTVDLTDLELETAAAACRAFASRKTESLKNIGNPTLRDPVENTAKRAAALVEMFEAARER
jgi:hypothetical protein